MYGKCDGKYSQNSFHLSSLNKYQRCAIIIEFMFADFKLSSLKLQPLTLQLFTEVNALLKES